MRGQKRESKEKVSNHKYQHSQLVIYSDHRDNQLIINLNQEKVITLVIKGRIKTYSIP